MKVIFIKDLKKQGKVNDIKEVSDGYAINYLIKNGYAVKYTKTSSKILDQNIKTKEKENANKLKEANEIKKKLENITLTFAVSSHQGKVFGSISTKQICEELSKKGFSIDKKMIHINEGISTLGTHKISVQLYKDVLAFFDVVLIEK